MYIQENDLKLKQYEFHQRKFLPWDLKLYLTERRINEWADHWDRNVYVSFSGGIDSTVLLHLVRKVLGNDIPAVFCDTGLEYPEISTFAKSIDNVKVLRPDMQFNKVIHSCGYPVISKETANKIRKLRHSNLSDKYRNYLLNGDERGKFGKLSDKWKPLVDAPFDTSELCCDIMKKKPFMKYVKETGRYPFIGITQDEGFKREHQYNKTGCNVYDGTTIKSQPMGFWTKQDVLRYVTEKDLPISTIYGNIETQNGQLRTTGEQRTGCMFCMFGIHLESEPNRFQRMEKTHPQRHCYCMKPVEQGGLGLSVPLDFIGIPYSNLMQISSLDYMKKIYAPGSVDEDNIYHINLKSCASDMTIKLLEGMGIKFRKREFTDENVIIYKDRNKSEISGVRCIILFDGSVQSKKLQSLKKDLIKGSCVKISEHGIYFEYKKQEIDMFLNNSFPA